MTDARPDRTLRLAGETNSDSSAPSLSSAPEASGGATDWIVQAVTRYEAPLIQYAARLLAGDVDRARDVVQETFLKLWTADRATVDGHLGQWLYRVCRNGALDVRRKEGRMTTMQDSEQIESPVIDRSSAPEAESTADPGALTQVLDMLQALPERQQEVIRLKFQGGLSYREIANVMELTVNHVGVLIHNGLKTIRERLARPAGTSTTNASAAAISVRLSTPQSEVSS